MEPKNMTTAGNTTELVMGRSAMEQGGYQMAALCLTLVIALVGGAITGNDLVGGAVMICNTLVGGVITGGLSEVTS
jgi:hypothetical protein